MKYRIPRKSTDNKSSRRLVRLYLSRAGGETSFRVHSVSRLNICLFIVVRRTCCRFVVVVTDATSFPPRRSRSMRRRAYRPESVPGRVRSPQRVTCGRPNNNAGSSLRGDYSLFNAMCVLFARRINLPPPGHEANNVSIS